MAFNSFGFIFLFMPLMLVGWNLLIHSGFRRSALLFLTAMSAVMYGMFNYRYLIILIISICITWLISLGMDHVDKRAADQASSSGKSDNTGLYRKLLLISGILFHLGILGYFKYSGFFLETINPIFAADFVIRDIMLPVGISFYTFSQIAYITDRFRREIPSYDILTYAAYVLYFPKIMQGPIALPAEIIDQMQDTDKLRWNTDRFARGLILFIIGLGKKVLLADTMAVIVRYVYSQAYYLDTVTVILTGIATAFNIYFDFSGYCDMADGISRMLGIELPQNFHSPFKASTVQELWQRWHITLSRFFTRYVYIPLGGSRRGQLRTAVNIMIIFFLSGLWHGAGWTYVVWGLLNGFLVVFDHFHRKKILPKAIRQILTFLFFSFSVIIFQAENLQIAGVIMRRLFVFTWPGWIYRIAQTLVLPETYVMQEAIERIAPMQMNIFYLILLIVVFVLSGFLMTKPCAREIADKSSFSRHEMIWLSVIAVWSVLSLSNVQTFVYFTF